MTILELSRLKSWSQFRAYQPFIYQATPGQFEGVDYWESVFGVSDPDSPDPINILEFVESPSVLYDMVGSAEDCIAAEASWYWDYDAQLLWVHVSHDASPLADTFSYGEAEGYSDDDVVYIDGIQYLPLIESLPEISERQDIVNYSRLADITGSVRLENKINSQTGDGYLDFLISENVYGNALNIYTIPDNNGTYARTDMTQRLSAVVDDYDIALDSVTLRYRDKRQSSRVSIPTELFTAADYPDIEEDIENTVIPLMYGEVREAPAICTNGTTESGTVWYRVALEMTALGTVYVFQNEIWSEVTPIESLTATGEFNLAEGDGRNADGGILPCKVVDAEGIAVTYATDIIVDLNERFLGMAFNDSHYDTTEWATEESSLSAVGLLIDSETTIPEIIVQLQNGSNVGFRYEVNPEGQRTIRIDNESRAITLHVPNLAIQNRTRMPAATDKDLLTAEVNIKYAKSYVSDKYISLRDDSEADTVEATYRNRPYTEIETLLDNATDAQERADYVLDRFSTIRPIITLDIMGSEYMDLRIYDIITAEITPSEFVDLEASTISGREYYGLKKVKILSTRKRLKEKMNSITGVIIGDMA